MSSGDAIWDRVLAGELDPESAEARGAAARDPALRARLDDLLGAESALAAIGRDLRAGPVEGEERALAGFRAAVTQPGPSGTARILRFVVLAVAASLAVWFGVRAVEDARPKADSGRYLGTKDGLLSPTEGVRQYGTFAWDLALPPNGSFDVEILDESGARIHVERDLATRTWTPPADVAARFPARIRWRVDVHDGTGLATSREARAWLDPSSPR